MLCYDPTRVRARKLIVDDDDDDDDDCIDSMCEDEKDVGGGGVGVGGGGGRPVSRAASSASIPVPVHGVVTTAATSVTGVRESEVDCGAKFGGGVHGRLTDGCSSDAGRSRTSVLRRGRKRAGGGGVDSGFGDAGVAKGQGRGSVRVGGSSVDAGEDSGRGGGAGDEDIEDEEDDDVVDDSNIVLSVVYKSSTLSAVHFDPRTSTLHIHADIRDAASAATASSSTYSSSSTTTTNFDVLRLLVFQLRPRTIITSARSDDGFMRVLEELTAGVGGGDGFGEMEEEGVGRGGGGAVLEVRPSTEFVGKAGRNRLLSLKVAGVELFLEGEGQESASKTANLMHVESVCGSGVDSDGMMGCAGAILQYVARERLVWSADEDAVVEIKEVKQFSLDGYMLIDQTALISLQIFQDEDHPNARSRRSREAASLFKILNLTRTPAGSALMRSWFMRPTLGMETLRFRHDSVGALVKPQVETAVGDLRGCLGHVKNVPRILGHLKTKMSMLDWTSLLRFTFYALKIRLVTKDFMRSVVPIFDKVNDNVAAKEIREIGSYINNVIDFDESANENRFVPKVGVDETLDELRRTYNGLDDLLSHAAREVAKCIPSEYSRTLNVIYFPQLGFLITIPLRDDMTEREDFMIPGLEFQFCTDRTVFFKNDQMKDMDEELGDIHSLIVDREIEIMQKLQETIREYVAVLQVASEVCAELDCLLAFSEASKMHGYRRPLMVEEPLLDISRGRHPILELNNNIAFVRNSTRLGVGDFEGVVDDGENVGDRAGERIVILTGPNSSGKSVYAKQVGLIVFMAHIGCFVPADSAKIGLTDKIFTRLQTLETVSKMQSTFLIDTQQVAIALRGSTRRSLLLFDEYGKGTATADGVGLLCAAIENLTARGPDCPRAIITTHFHEIFTFNLLEPHPLIKECTMEFMQHGEGALAESDSPVTFLYRVVPGRASFSLGFHCAMLAGLSKQTLARGELVARQLTNGEPITPVLTERQNARNAAMEKAYEFFAGFDCEKGQLSDLWDVLKRIPD